MSRRQLCDGMNVEYMALSSGVPEIVKFAEVQERKYKDGIIN